MQTVCCVCQKTKSQVGWIKKPARKESLVSHGYCPECFCREMERAQGWLQERTAANRGLSLGR